LNPDGGAILNICGELKPDKAYLFYNINSKESDSDYFAAASQTKPALEKLSIDMRSKIKDSESNKSIPNPEYGKPTLECEIIKILCDDPTDYDIIYPQMNHELENIIESNGLDHEYYINITSGTPTMHLIWVLLHHQKKHLNSTLLRSLEKKHQKQYDNKPYLEVNFNLDDFPQIQTPSAIKRQLTIEKREKDQLRHKVEVNELNKSFKGFIGESKSIINVKEQIIGEVDSTTHILILGERGTGKEVVANAIWQLYRKKNDKELVTQDCSGIAETLIEGILFGYMKGSHSTADSDKKGLLESCNNRMIFLDEIGNLSIEAQQKLLRFIQFGTITPIGANRSKKLNTQIIAATNKDVDNPEIFASDVKDRFDETITLPPLRERKKDIKSLVDYCINMECKKRGLPGLLILSEDLLESIIEFNWPSNVRGLFKFIAKLVRKFGSSEVGIKDLPERFTDMIRTSENEYDFLLPDLPLVNTNIDKVTKDYHNAILEKARSMSNSLAGVDRLLGQKDVEKARQHRSKK
jgi:transcriptional regulator with GAF, ATPase, and Fis domain